MLSDIDIQKAMKVKLDVEMPRVPNPWSLQPSLGSPRVACGTRNRLLLPCNVTVCEEDDGSVTVGFLDPHTLVQMTSNPDVARVADEAGERLGRVLSALDAVA